jgi:hypothetical protein
MMLERGFLVGATRLTKRVWQLYVAHIILFVIYIASISYLALRFGDSEIINEFNVAGLVDQATETLRQGLLLKFKPVNLDVLPLYIVLMGFFPPGPGTSTRIAGRYFSCSAHGARLAAQGATAGWSTPRSRSGSVSRICCLRW